MTLSIEDKYVPDLTLIDLPGIARVSVGGQAADVPEQVNTFIQLMILKQRKYSKHFYQFLTAIIFKCYLKTESYG